MSTFGSGKFFSQSMLIQRRYSRGLTRIAPARQFHRSLADVNHTVAIWQNLHARFTEHTGLATPPVVMWSTLMRKPKK